MTNIKRKIEIHRRLAGMPDATAEEAAAAIGPEARAVNGCVLVDGRPGGRYAWSGGAWAWRTDWRPSDRRLADTARLRGMDGGRVNMG